MRKQGKNHKSKATKTKSIKSRKKSSTIREDYEALIAKIAQGGTDKIEESLANNLIRVVELSEKKSERMLGLKASLNELKTLFQELIKNKEVKKFIIKDFEASKIGCASYKIIRKMPTKKNKELSNFLKLATKFEEKYKVELDYRLKKNKEISLEYPPFARFPLFYKYIIKRNKLVLNCEDPVSLVASFFLSKKGAIPRMEINDPSKANNLLKRLSDHLSPYLPTVITYQAQNGMKTFLLSIPEDCSFTEASKSFDKEITMLHSEFFKSLVGRPKTKEIYQSIFDEHFPKAYKEAGTKKGACIRIAKIIFEEYGNSISAETIRKSFLYNSKHYKKESGKVKYIPQKRRK